MGVSSAKLVCDIMERPSLPARRPSTGARPGRCAICSAADTHRPLSFVGQPFQADAIDTHSTQLGSVVRLESLTYPGGTTVTVTVRVIPLAVSVAVMV